MHLLNRECQFKAYKNDKSNFIFKRMLFAKFTQARSTVTNRGITAPGRGISISSDGFFFSKFYRRHYELVSKFKVGLKSLLQQGLSEPEFYGDLVYKLRKMLGGLIFLISSEKLSCVTNVLDGWLVVVGLTALCDNISVYIGPSPKEREKEEKG